MFEPKLHHDFGLLKSLSAENNLTRALHLLVNELSECVDYCGIVITLIDSNKEKLICQHVALHDGRKELNKTLETYGFSLKNEDSLCRAFNQSKCLQITPENSQFHPKITQNRTYVWECDSILFVPICDSMEDPFGVIMLTKTQGSFSEETLATVEERLDLIAGSLYHCHKFTEVEKKEKTLTQLLSEQEAFLSFTNHLMRLTSREEICQLVNEEFLRRYPFDFASILLEENGKLEVKDLNFDKLVFGQNASKVEKFFTNLSLDLTPDQGAAVLAFIQNITLHIPDAEALKGMPMSDADKHALETFGTPRTVLHLPLRNKNKTVGVASLISVRDVVNLNAFEQKIIDQTGEFIGNAIENAELYEQVQNQKAEIESLNNQLQQRVETLGDMAIKDQLTGLYNFGYFAEELGHRVEEYSRHNEHQELALILLDIDHFKRFNDTYGHQAGNVVLQEFAKCLQKQTRKMDVVCRYGGEEFVCILPMCAKNKAFECAERIRKAVAQLNFIFNDERVKITSSIGVATMRPGLDTATLIEAADQALYQAKSEGRNCTIIAQSDWPKATEKEAES